MKLWSYKSRWFIFCATLCMSIGAVQRRYLNTTYYRGPAVPMHVYDINKCHITFSAYPSDNHHSSNDVCWREGILGLETNIVLLIFSGAFARNIRRLLANDLGAAFADDRDDDEAGRTRKGKSDSTALWSILTDLIWIVVILTMSAVSRKKTVATTFQ